MPGIVPIGACPPSKVRLGAVPCTQPPGALCAGHTSPQRHPLEHRQCLGQRAPEVGARGGVDHEDEQRREAPPSGRLHTNELLGRLRLHGVLLAREEAVHLGLSFGPGRLWCGGEAWDELWLELRVQEQVELSVAKGEDSLADGKADGSDVLVQLGVFVDRVPAVGPIVSGWGCDEWVGERACIEGLFMG